MFEAMVVSSPAEFAAAVAEHEFGDFAFEPQMLARAARSIAEARLLVVGEPHGVRETPSVGYALATALATRAIAFEWSYEEMEEPVQAFLRSGSFDFDRLWTLPASAEFFCGDGRITAGHFALLERLHRERRLDQVIVFDRLDPADPSEDWEAQVRVREPEMAARLLAEWDRRFPLLVLTGAFHAQLEASEGETMAAHLAHDLAGLQPAMLDYASGHCWSRGELHDVSGPMPDAPMKFRLPEATPAVVPGGASAKAGTASQLAAHASALAAGHLRPTCNAAPEPAAVPVNGHLT